MAFANQFRSSRRWRCARKFSLFRRAYVPTTALTKAVKFDDEMMHIYLKMNVLLARRLGYTLNCQIPEVIENIMKISPAGIIPASILIVILSMNVLMAQTRQDATYRPDRVIVKFTTEMKNRSSVKHSIRAGVSAHLIKRISFIDAEIWEITHADVDEVITRLKDDSRIEYIERDYIISLDQIIPNDPDFNNQWNLHNTGQSGGTFDADIDAPEAWNLQTGSNIVIGIVDGGIDYEHPDLAANIWVNASEDINRNGRFDNYPAAHGGDIDGIDNDGNGYIDDVVGWDFVTCDEYDNDGNCIQSRLRDNNPIDENGHGTHVSGIIAAAGNNGIGITGVSWSAKLVAIRCFNRNGQAPTSDVLSALEYAAQVKAQLINNSWGGGPYTQAMYDLIKAADSLGMLFVASAGNDGANNDYTPYYPASFDLKNIISVAATDHQDHLSIFSNYGATAVDVGAPGQNIYSTLPTNGGPWGELYGIISGTSMAAPHVTGVASLLWSENPRLSHIEVKDRILSSVDAKASLAEKNLSSGRLNAHKALQLAFSTLLTETDTLNFGIAIPGTFDTLQIAVKNLMDVSKTITLSTDNPAFRLQSSSLTIAGHDTSSVPVIFNPPFNGNFTGTLILSSADTVIQITLLGSAGNIAVAQFEPKRFFIEKVPPISNLSDTLTIRNHGATNLDWHIDGNLPSWLSISPMSGNVAPNQSTIATIKFTGSGENYSNYQAIIHALTNDPNLPVVTIPIEISIDQFTKITTGVIVNDGAWNSQGGSWSDYDNDGFLDLFIPNGGIGPQRNALYHNNGGRSFNKIIVGEVFEDTGPSAASTWGDYNNDGYPDLFVSNWLDWNNFLYMNTGDGTFTKIENGPLVNDGGYSLGCSWGDYDNDGNLDLFVVNYPNHFLYHNIGDGTFSKVTNSPVANGRGGHVNWIDYDDDGDLDLFMANFGPDFFFRNDGNGIFTHIDPSPVSDPRNSKSSSWGDYDNDGDFDLFIANIAGENNSLFTNNGDGTFTEITNSVVVTDGGNSYGSNWGDFDNDGHLDLFVANIFEANFLYQNNGDGSFTRLTQSLVANALGGFFGTTWIDYDNDGDLDLFIADGGNNNHLYANRGNGNQWLEIKCRGTVSNRSAIGAKVFVKATIAGSSFWQLRDISGQNGWSSQNPVAHFGFGNTTVVDSIKVEWPSGITQILNNITTDQILTIVEDSTLLGIDDPSHAPNRFSLMQNYPNPFNPLTTIEYVIPIKSQVWISIYNVLGQKIRTLVDEVQNSGHYTIRWNTKDDRGNSFSSGIYFYQMKAGKYTNVKKLILLR